VLHNFNFSDGYFSNGELIRDAAGDLYGMTEFGGLCCGVIFKLDPNGNETVLHRFNADDGANPVGGLVQDRAGNFFGATTAGGQFSSGVIFKLTP